MKKGETYFYDKIHKYSEENNYDLIEHGNGLFGADFVVLVNDVSDVISFVATGYHFEKGFSYECIYYDS